MIEIQDPVSLSAQKWEQQSNDSLGLAFVQPDDRCAFAMMKLHMGGE